MATVFSKGRNIAEKKRLSVTVAWPASRVHQTVRIVQYAKRKSPQMSKGHAAKSAAKTVESQTEESTAQSVKRS